MKKISVIVPVYNTGKYLTKCLDSIINQTLKDIEIIIIDDGSNKKPSKLIKKYKENITYIENKHMGIGYTRNTGLKASKGEYIAFVDSDDYIEPNMFEDYYKYAKENDLDIVVGNYYRVINNQKIEEKIPYFEIDKVNKDILTKIDFGPCNKIFKRKLLIDNKILFDENLKYEDMPFASKSLFCANKIGHINNTYYNYVIRSGSETTSFSDKNFDIFIVLDKFIDLFKKNYFEETEYVVVGKLLDYNIQQRTNKDTEMRNKFIDYSFDYIYQNFSNYKRNKYLKKEQIFKKMIKQNKLLTKLYCHLYLNIKNMW